MSKREFGLVLLISLVSYLVFFYKNLDPGMMIYSGADSVRLHYQTKGYTYNILHEGRFPFWTEKILMGYPIYADMERGILNPLNLGLVFLFGPVVSYKILHLLFYLLGSISLYLLLKKEGIGKLGYFVANLIYYFSFFLIFHQQHFNIVLTAYALPAMIFFLRNYLEENKHAFVYALTFIFVTTLLFYFGSFQILLMNIVFSAVYAILTMRSLLAKRLVLKVVFLALFTLILILPGLIPQAGLYLSSPRVSRDVFSEGSLRTAGLLNLAVPFLFGKGDSYIGMMASTEYFIHEIYVYVGVSVFIFYLLGFLPYLTGKRKIINNVIISFALFLMLWGSIPLVKYVAVFPFTFFRYWVRASYVLVFIFAVGIAHLMNADIRVRRKLTNFPFVVALVIALGLLTFTGYIQYANEYTFTLKKLFYFLTHPTGYTIAWYIPVVLSLIIVIFSSRLRKVFKWLVATIVVFDIVFYGLAASYNLFKDISQYQIVSASNKETSGRFFDFTGGNNASVTLVNGYWNILGYAELAPANTIRNLTELGLDNQKDAVFINKTKADPEIVEKLRNLGVSSIVINESTTAQFSGNIVSGSHVEVEKIGEGIVKLNTTSSGPEQVKTKINYYPGWTLKLDGLARRELMFTDSSGFINANIPAGPHTVEFVFRPLHLYYGLAASGFSIILLCIYVFIFRKEIL